jgi:hypothetical protein
VNVVAGSRNCRHGRKLGFGQGGETAVKNQTLNQLCN